MSARAMGDDEGPERVAGALALALRETGMDAALVTEVANERETVLWAAGRIDGLTPGASLPLDETICRRVLEGRVGGAIPDTAREHALADVPLVRARKVGAYLGVPVRTSDAHLYVLCCLARERRPELGEDDLRFLAGLAESVRAVVQPA